MTLYDALAKTNSPRSIYRRALDAIAPCVGNGVSYAIIGQLRIISAGGVFAVPAAVLVCTVDCVIIADISAQQKRYYEIFDDEISEVTVRDSRLEIHVGDTIYSLKCAFREADRAADALRRMTEHEEEDDFPPADDGRRFCVQTYTTRVSGTMQYYGDEYAQWTVRELAEEESVFLERDTDNRYDPFAIRIKNSEGVQFGWIPYADYGDSPMQFDLCQFISDGAEIRAKVKKIYTRRDKSLGVLIEIQIWL